MAGGRLSHHGPSPLRRSRRCHPRPAPRSVPTSSPPRVGCTCPSSQARCQGLRLGVAGGSVPFHTLSRPNGFADACTGREEGRGAKDGSTSQTAISTVSGSTAHLKHRTPPGLHRLLDYRLLPQPQPNLPNGCRLYVLLLVAEHVLRGRKGCRATVSGPTVFGHAKRQGRGTYVGMLAKGNAECEILVRDLLRNLFASRRQRWQRPAGRR